MSISHSLAVICTRKFLCYLLSLGQTFVPPTNHPPTLTSGRFLFWKSDGSLPGSEGRIPPKMKFIGSIVLRYFEQGYTHTDTQSKLHLTHLAKLKRGINGTSSKLMHTVSLGCGGKPSPCTDFHVVIVMWLNEPFHSFPWACPQWQNTEGRDILSCYT